MRRGVVGSLIFFAVAFALPLVIYNVATPPTPEPLQVLWPTPEFSLLDQDSAAFASSDLAGKVWLASFVYTKCPDVCPLVTQRMAALRDSIARNSKLRDQVRLLSISVDPLRDTPSVLRQYAQTFSAKKPNWLFLTGPADQVIPLINQGFHLSTIHPQVHDPHEQTHAHDSIAADYMVSHSDRIVLIDASGRVRGTYVSSDQEALRQLWVDLGRVTNETN